MISKNQYKTFKPSLGSDNSKYVRQICTRKIERKSREITLSDPFFGSERVIAIVRTPITEVAPKINQLKQRKHNRDRVGSMTEWTPDNSRAWAATESRFPK